MLSSLKFEHLHLPVVAKFEATAPPLFVETKIETPRTTTKAVASAPATAANRIFCVLVKPPSSAGISRNNMVAKKF